MSKIGKALLSTAMIAATAATFASTTYAFVVLEDQVNIQDFEVNISTQKGLLVSMDPLPEETVMVTDEAAEAPATPKDRNFYQDLPISVIKDAIAKSTGKSYDTVRYSGVSFKNAEAELDLSVDGMPKMVKDSVQPAEEKPDDYMGKHVLVDAEKHDFLKLDFTFRLVHQGDIEGNYGLYFYNSSITNATGKPTTVKLVNSMTTKTKTYLSGEEVTVDPKDAMRVAAFNKTDSIFTVVEPSIGLGSAAIEGSEAEDNNPATNAMYTYHNNVHPLDQFTEAATDNAGLKTVKSFDLAPKLGTFTDKGSATYDDIDISVYVFLEGWDADYFMGIPVEASKLKIKLGFQIKKELDA